MGIAIDLFSTEVPVLLGQGIDWATGNILQSALVGERNVKLLAGPAAKSAKFQSFLVERRSEFWRERTGAARASLGNGIFSGAGAGGENLFKNTNSYSIRIVVAVDVDLAAEALDAPEVSPVQASAAEFAGAHGTHLIVGRQKGGSLIGILSIDTNSDQERRDLMIELGGSGNFGFVDFSASGSMRDSLKETLSTRNVTLQYASHGGNFNPKSNDWQSFLEAADTFVDSVTADTAFVRKIWIEGYEYAKNITGDFARELRKLALQQQYRLDDLANLMESYKEALSNIEHIKSHRERFAREDVEIAIARGPEFEDAIKGLSRENDQILLDPKYQPDLTPIPMFMRPAERTDIVEVQPAGRNPHVFAYTGPSFTGEKFELTHDGDIPANLKGQIRSIKITGDFSPNSWWISFETYTNGPIEVQTFVTPCEVKVISNIPGANSGTYRAFDINTGNEETIFVSSWFYMVTKYKIVRNPDTSHLPNSFRNPMFVKDPAQWVDPSRIPNFGV